MPSTLIARYSHTRFLAVCLVVCAIVSVPSTVVGADSIDKESPTVISEFTLKDYRGKTHSLSDYKDKIVVTYDDLVCVLYFDKRLKIKIFNGSENPMLGWYSRSFNPLQETNTIVCKGIFEGDVSLHTVITLS